MKKTKPVWCGVILFGVLVSILHLSDEYHFYYVEQFQLFQQTWDYVAGKLFQPGGVALLAGEYLTQFFILPFGGPVVVAVLLTVTGLLARVAIREDGVLCLFPVLCLLLIQFNFNYLLQGTVAYLLLLGFLCIYRCISGFRYRLAAGLLFVPLLFWWGGAVAGLLAVCMTVTEMTVRVRRVWPMLLTGLVFAATAGGCVSLAIVSDLRLAVLPDMYFFHLLTPPPVIYFSWIVLPALIAVASPIRRRMPEAKTARKTIFAVQGAVIVALAWWLIPQNVDTGSRQLKKLDYFARSGQWEQIIATSGGAINNYLYLGYLNMALAEKGELADRLFFFDQHGITGIFCNYNRTFAASCLLSEVYFTFGEIASSQRMAFESMQSVYGDASPRNLQRLVQTNLIYGEYAVAERYIRLLERTFGYRKWANGHRRFLYNDAAVEADPLLGVKRRYLPVANTLTYLEGMEGDLISRIEHRPDDRVSVQLLGVICLLSKNMDLFRELIERSYGTPALPVLPYSFQEAVILLDDNNPDYWQRFNVSENVIRRFAGYREIVMRNRNNPQVLPGLLSGSYGNSFWYYYIYK